jgi:hypothetical protein
VRNFNIMLKFARLYGFEHARTSEQIEKTWSELQTALSGESDGEILLGSSGNQLLLNGAPLGSSGADRSLAQLLTSIGISSVHFSSNITREDFDKFVRVFPSRGGPKALLTEEYKRTMEGVSGVRLNEICFVPADSASVSLELAAQITGSVLRSTGADDTTSWFTDPERLLQLIAAAEGSRGGGAEGSGSGEAGGGGSAAGGSGTGVGTGSGTGGDIGGGTGSGGGAGTGTGGGGTGAGVGSGSGPGVGADTGSGGGSGVVTATGVFAGAGTGVGAGGGVGTGVETGSGIGASSGTGAGTGSGGSGAGSGTGSAGGGTGTGSGTGGGRMGSGRVGGGIAGGVGGGVGGAVAKRLRGITNFWDEVKASMRGLTIGSGPLVTPEQEDVCKVLRLLRQLPQNSDAPEGHIEPAAFQSRLSEISVATRVLFHDALVALASQVPAGNHDKLFLQRLAEHMAIRFAVDAFERGDTPVNAVQQLLERMGQEISALRDVLTTQENKLKTAGIAVESYTDQLERQFWNAVPEASKRSILLSPDAWSVPPRHISDYVRERRSQGDHETCCAILTNYLKGLESEKAEARKKVFTGLCDLSECFGDELALLGEAISRVASCIGSEKDRGLRGLASAAFVRLSQEGASRRSYAVLELVLSSLDTLESQDQTLVQGLQQRIGLEDRLSEFLEDALSSRQIPKGLVEILQRLPRSGAKRLAKRFGKAGFREDCELLLTLFEHLGPEGTEYLKQSLADAPPLEVVEIVGLLSRTNPELLIQALPQRLRECPRSFHDLVVRRIAFSGGPERGQLLTQIYDFLDPLIRPLALDEIGMSGDAGAIPWLIKRVQTENGRNELVRLKAIEAAGRLRAKDIVPVLQKIVEAKLMFRWQYPSELRIVAAQTLAKIDPETWNNIEMRADLTPAQIASFPALDADSNASALRQRRYLRFGLSRPLTAVTTNLREDSTLELHSLNLGGGLGVIDSHCPEGTILALKFALGRRSLPAQVFVRKNLTGEANSVAFEIVEMTLADRSRLRHFLSEAGRLQPGTTSAKNRVRRAPMPSKR